MAAVDARQQSGIQTTTPVNLTVNPSAVSPMIVTVLWEGAQTCDSVTFKGTETFTRIGSADIDGASHRITQFGLANPTTGSGTLAVNFSANMPSGAVVFVDTTTGAQNTGTPWRTVYTRKDANGTGPGTTVTDSVAGDLVFHGVVVHASTMTFDGGETAVLNTDYVENPGGSGWSGGMSFQTAVGANTAVGCTDVATYVQHAFALAPAGASLTVVGRTVLDYSD